MPLSHEQELAQAQDQIRAQRSMSQAPSATPQPKSSQAPKQKLAQAQDQIRAQWSMSQAPSATPQPKSSQAPTGGTGNPDAVQQSGGLLQAPEPPRRADTNVASSFDELNRNLDSDSDYIQRARTSGLQTANSRGLLNSSMAAGASQGAAIDAAAPFALADADAKNRLEQQFAGADYSSQLSAQEAGQGLVAQTQAEGSELTRQTQAEGSEFTRQTQAEEQARERQIADIQAREGLSRQEAEQRLGAQTQAEQAAITQQTQAEQAQRDLLAQQGEQNLELAEFNAESATNLAQVNNRHEMLLQASQDARTFMSGIEAQISSILQNIDMDSSSKAAAVNILIDYANQYLTTQTEILKAAGIDDAEVGELGRIRSDRGGNLTTGDNPTIPTGGGGGGGGGGFGGGGDGGGPSNPRGPEGPDRILTP